MLFHLSAVYGGNAARNVAIHWQRQERKRPRASKQAKFTITMHAHICTKPLKKKNPIRKDVISTQVRPQGYTQCVLVSNSEFKQSFCLF